MDKETTAVSTANGQVRVPDRASKTQVAAITAAIGAHVQDQRQAIALAQEADDEQSWDGERFAFTGRLEALTGCTVRVPRAAPTDKWTAAGRRDRYDR